MRETKEWIKEKVRGVVETREEGWKEKDGMIFWKGRIYIPDSIVLREEILRCHHDQKLTGHPGYTKTHELIMRNYWWPRLMNDVKRYVLGYELC